MFIKKGKTDWVLLIAVATIAGAAGGGLMSYINDTVMQNNLMSQEAPVNVVKERGAETNTTNPAVNGIEENSTIIPEPSDDGIEGSINAN
ncbi:MAG: hypothetical protein MUD10_03395 [Candidatus Pacebacteria bacterium]|jgi:hypothetical protein|nr:hypothetical protein [Candidatus Paceibacterota bacterium]